MAAALTTIVQLRLMMPGPVTAFSTADNPVAKSNSLWTRFLTFTYLPVFNFKLLVYPVTLSFDWGMDAIPRVTTIFDTRNIVSVVFYATAFRFIQFNVNTFRKKVPSIRSSIQRRIGRAKRKQMLAAAASMESKLPEMQCANNGSWLSLYSDLCVCSICKHGLDLRHTNSCRTLNNNNVPLPNVPCGCPPFRHPSPTPSSSSSSSSSSSQSSSSSLSSSSSSSNSPLRRTPSESSTILLSIALLVLPFLPASNLLFYVGFVVAERILYLPSVGFCLLIGLGVGRLLDDRSSGSSWKRSRRILSLAAIAVLLIACSARTMQRNRDWRDEENLYRSAIKINPPKGKTILSMYLKIHYNILLFAALGNLGSVLSSQGRYSEAKEALQLALEHRPNMADVHYNL